MVSHGDIDALARDAQMALYHVASGLPSRARADVERALARADKVLESLNRESLAAQQLLDACLYLVRAHLQDGKRQAAREQALECRRLVPDIEPDGTMHPPDVMGVLAEAEAELRQREPGSLRVESAPDACAVYVNGRHLGHAPLELPQLSPGEYRVQAECEEGVAGRVHRVAIGNRRIVKRIDTRFDAAVQTSLDIALRYDTVDAQREHAHSDALELARIVGVSAVVLVLPVLDASASDTHTVQVERIDTQNGALAAAMRLRVDPSGTIEPSALAVAVRDLRSGGHDDNAASGALALAQIQEVARLPRPATDRERAAQPAAEPGPPRTTRPSQERPSDLATDVVVAKHDVPADEPWSPSAVGVALGTAGAVATVASWVLFGHQLSLEFEYADELTAAPSGDYRATLDDLDDIEYVPLAIGGAGAALLTASLPSLLPPNSESEVPGLAIASGAFGAALAVTGTVLLVRGGNCDEYDIEGRCIDILTTTRLGGLLLEGAFPWLSVPVVYLLRGASSPSDTSLVTIKPTNG
ncbi:MAG TPA: PEGA domain-containing protein, partial [Polyangiales bacterium]|nr:PEGA domain-containing protein [Polyangiales bacterium]